MNFTEAVIEELKRANPDTDYILGEAAKEVADIPELPAAPNFTPDMVLIFKKNPTDESPASFCIDYNTLLRFAQSSNQSVPVAYDQVVEKNNIAKEDCALLVKDIDLERTKKEISAAPNDMVKESKLNNLLTYTDNIRTLKSEGVNIIKYK